jgi:Rrf2 family iron-sulfur cluster assembly transcriptional regulator
MFSNLTHNAVNALMLVAQHQRTGPVTTEFISRQLGLSISYLESLMSSLKKKGFVISYRGPGGGYCTLGKPADVLLLNVILAFEAATPTKPEADQGELDKNLMSSLVTDFVADHLRGVSLEDVLAELPEQTLNATAMAPLTRADHKPRFKPLKIHKLPTGPNSVFNLAQSMAV